MGIQGTRGTHVGISAPRGSQSLGNLCTWPILSRSPSYPILPYVTLSTILDKPLMPALSGIRTCVPIFVRGMMMVAVSTIVGCRCRSVYPCPGAYQVAEHIVR